MGNPVPQNQQAVPAEEGKETQSLTEKQKRPCANEGRWVQALRDSVRPVITYAFFLVFIAVKLVLLFSLLQTKMPLASALQNVWDEQTQALFASIISFWFSSHHVSKMSSTS